MTAAAPVAQGGNDIGDPGRFDARDTCRERRPATTAPAASAGPKTDCDPAGAQSRGTVQEGALCEGLLDYLVARLSEIERFQKAFWVVPAAEVRRQGAVADLDVGRGLGATLALDITVQRSGERTIMSAVLRDAEQPRVPRSTTKDIPSETSLLDQTVDAVIDMLDLEIGSDARAALRAGTTTVVEASTLYAQALAYKPYEQARTMLDRYDQRQNLRTGG